MGFWPFALQCLWSTLNNEDSWLLLIWKDEKIKNALKCPTARVTSIKRKRKGKSLRSRNIMVCLVGQVSRDVLLLLHDRRESKTFYGLWLALSWFMWSILVIVYPLSLSLSLMPMAGYSFQGFYIHFEEVHVCVSSLPPSVLFSWKYLSKLQSIIWYKGVLENNIFSRS